ncbi:MAG: zinc ABC transporter substrate-binding protein [Neomegalonema sp.]|nr:zinc ABC transporter substrate-binding protein [Neomegalonema sp.]
MYRTLPRRRMPRLLSVTALALAMTAATSVARAELRVATTILPVHSLVAGVMDGAGTPDLIVPPGASPHRHAMKPSEAAALERAEVVFWVGEGLEPWLPKSLAALAGDATVVELAEIDGLTTLANRPSGVDIDGLEDHHHHGEDDDHDDDHHEEHGDHHDNDHHDGEDHAHREHHDEEHHDEEHHDEEHRDDDQAHDEHHDEHHGHGDIDPHMWLDPENAKIWTKAIAKTLSAADPANAATYAANAAKQIAALDALIGKLTAELAPLKGARYIVFHDAYQYFENRFGVSRVAAIALGDATPPGPALLAQLQAHLRETGVQCAFAEPQFPPKLLDTVTAGLSVRKGELDPMGSDIPAGPAHYPTLMANLANGLRDCLQGE